MILKKTRFRDIAERETKSRDALTFRKDQLEKKNADGISLTALEQAELARIVAVQKNLVSQTGFSEVSDPLFVGVRELFYGDDCARKQTLLSHNQGLLQFSSVDANGDSQKVPARDVDSDTIALSALIIGLLEIDAAQGPPVIALAEPVDGMHLIVPDKSHQHWPDLTQRFFSALGEAKGMDELAELVLPILAIEGDPDGRGKRAPSVNSTEFAQVMRDLKRRGVTADNEIMLRRRIHEALNRIQHVADNGPYAKIPFADTGINPPDLDGVTDYNIIGDNVRLMGPMIIAAMFDELKAFQVVDHLVERFQNGTLTIGSGDAGQRLYQYWRDAPNRMSELERRTFYATTMGIPGGEADGMVNREFNDLWLRFVSSVSEYVRQNEVDNMLRTKIPVQVSYQQVRKAARDLATNLSLHGYGMAFYAAVELQGQINFMIELLGDPEIRSNYGARDMWQVIDQVATLELGGAKTSSRYRTLATCGTIITAWLAGNIGRIMRPTGPLLDMNKVANPQPHAPGEKAITHPNDFDLVNACELWLADTAVSDMRVEQMSQPREAPTQTSRPIQVPSVVQDMLGDMGDLGVSFANNR